MPTPQPKARLAPNIEILNVEALCFEGKCEGVVLTRGFQRRVAMVQPRMYVCLYRPGLSNDSIRPYPGQGMADACSHPPPPLLSRRTASGQIPPGVQPCAIIQLAPLPGYDDVLCEVGDPCSTPLEQKVRCGSEETRWEGGNDFSVHESVQ